MTREEAEQIRKGDVLTIRPLVSIRDGLDTHGYALTEHNAIRPKDILSCTPAPREIKVWDLVFPVSGIIRNVPHRVIAIDGDTAWIKQTHTSARTEELLSELRHAGATEGHAPPCDPTSDFTFGV